MPEQKQIRALVAVRDDKAGGALRAYLRERGDVAEILADAAAEIYVKARTSSLDLLLLEIEITVEPLAEWRREFPSLPIVVLAHADADIAFQSARLGATEILTLPLQEADFAPKLDKLLAGIVDQRPGLRTHAAKSMPAAHRELPSLFSSSPRMADIRDTIHKVATTSATVLIRGESGVGKEIAARMIFAQSPRHDKPFVKVNCAAIPNELLESELFGYEAGAFTGAQRAKPGKFELADKGTLFLDEIGEMHPALQAKLLHVLQDGEFARLGAKRDMAVDVRVLCATNKLLEQRVSEGLFREDLFYRINVVTVHIPPLRERRDEIPGLIQYFTEKYSAVYGRYAAPLSEEVIKFLVTYTWPGNIRELENLCKRYVIVGGATQIVRELTMHTLERPAPPRETIEPPPGAEGRSIRAVEAEPSLLEIGRRAAWSAEREAVRKMLSETKWNRREASRRLRVSYKALLNKIQQMELEDAGLEKH